MPGFFPLPIFPILSWGGLIPNFGDGRSGFGDQKILSDLGMVGGISNEIPQNRGKLPLLNRLNSGFLVLGTTASESISVDIWTFPRSDLNRKPLLRNRSNMIEFYFHIISIATMV